MGYVVFQSQFRWCVLWCGRIPRPAVSASAEDHTDNLSSYLSLSQVQRGILFQSDQCDSDFKTENGLRIHKGKSLKEAFSGVCDDHKDNLPTYLSLKSSLALPFVFFLLSSVDVGSHSPWMSYMKLLAPKSHPFRKRRNASSKLCASSGKVN